MALTEIYLPRLVERIIEKSTAFIYSLILAALLIAAQVLGASQAYAQETLLTERSATKKARWYQRSNITVEKLAKFSKDKNARIIDLDINSVSPFRVSASLVRNTNKQKSDWWWYYGLTEKQVNNYVKEHKARLLDIEAYQSNGKTRFAVVMVPNTGSKAVAWWWYFNKTPKQLDQLLEDNKARLSDIERYRAGGKTRYAAIMLKNTGQHATQWWWYYGQKLDQLKGRLKRKKARILDVERYKTTDGVRYAAVLVPVDKSANNYWWHYHGISADKVVEMARHHNARLIDIEPPAKGTSGYSAVFVDNGMIKNGDCGGKLKVFDKKITRTMKKFGAPGATVAVIKGKKLLHACGYGYADVKKNIPMKADARMRIASISKLLTVSALRKLEQDKGLNLQAKMIKNLGAAKPKKPYKDKRVKQISIQNLIDHRGGWDRGLGLSRPMFMSNQISAELGTPKPTSCKNVIRYMFQKEKLDFKPGTKPTKEGSDTYSNFGYCVLGRIIENVSGKSYQRYVRDEVLRPIGINNMRIGRGLKKNRYADEPQYYDKPFSDKVKPVYPNAPEQVYMPDGGFHLEAMDAHGGWLGSAIDITRYLAFAKPGPIKKSHGGALWGTRTFVKTKGGITVAIFMNLWTPNEANFSKLIDDSIAEVNKWPSKNLWRNYGYENP